MPVAGRKIRYMDAGGDDDDEGAYTYIHTWAGFMMDFFFMFSSCWSLSVTYISILSFFFFQ